MKSRHLFMLSLGGVIGTGLFLNSGYVINQAGPGGALLAYLFGGLILYLVMVCLGELAVYLPVTGSFHTYAKNYIGPASGFTIGMVYFIGSAVTAGVEFTASGILMQQWFPNTPVWIWCALFIVALFLLNALTTKAFAESEYWFAGMKVLAVILFIIIGGGAIFGFISMEGRAAPLSSNFTEFGLFPEGLAAVFITMLNVVFSYQGSELIGIAAGESENPEKDIPKAIRNVVFRIFFFYIATTLVLTAIFSYKELGVLESPFVTVLEAVGIPYAASVMNFVVLIAILSVGNSCLYASTRLLWVFSHENLVPRVFGKLTKRKVPLNALLLTMVFSLLSLLTSFMAANTVYILLTSVAGIAVTITWMGIVFSQYKFRKHFLREGGKVDDLKFSVPLYPFFPLFALAVCGVILTLPLFYPDQRLGLFVGAGFIGACYLYYYLKHGREKNQKTSEGESRYVK
ncbi:amino acid permease [Halobacillus shinanisalinarum]|uniref:Amino acid permease n=1 Tax=Halobacillus shinanisalinarum TaxID=2932258 RepID=A0ABY4H9R3_9BACI|nr:amino acid permease [Halobacillus shinanisalinarum]UOQ95737.1 amino acid permease [Halobacillus shinanisalinarum]